MFDNTQIGFQEMKNIKEKQRIFLMHILKDIVKIIEMWNLSKKWVYNWKSNIWGENTPNIQVFFRKKGKRDRR